MADDLHARVEKARKFYQETYAGDPWCWIAHFGHADETFEFAAVYAEAENRELRAERDQARAELAAVRVALKQFDHCEEDSVVVVAEVASTSFDHAMNRAKSAEKKHG